MWNELPLIVSHVSSCIFLISFMCTFYAWIIVNDIIVYLNFSTDLWISLELITTALLFLQYLLCLLGGYLSLLQSLIISFMNQSGFKVEYKIVYKRRRRSAIVAAQIKHKLSFDTTLKLDLECFYSIHVFSWFYNFISAFLAVGYVLEVAMLFYPFFGCLTTEHRLIGSTMGLLYTFMW